MPITEDQLAARIDNSKMVATDGKPRAGGAAQAKAEGAIKPDRDLSRGRQPRNPQPEPEPDDEYEDEEPSEEIEYEEPENQDADGEPEADAEEPEEDADADDGIDDPNLPSSRLNAKAMETITQLREELAELRGMLKTRNADPAASTDGDDGAAAPDSPADKKKQKASVKAVKEHLQKNMDKWGNLANDIGLPQLLDTLEGIEGRLNARDQAEQKAAEEQKQQLQQQQVEAANQIHRQLNAMARSEPKLMSLIGFGTHETLSAKTLQTRQRIMRAAFRALEDSKDEVDAKIRQAPITLREAIAEGARKVTGIATQKTTPEQQARTRARNVKPIGNTETSGVRRESTSQIESRLAANIDNALKFLQR